MTNRLLLVEDLEQDPAVKLSGALRGYPHGALFLLGPRASAWLEQFPGATLLSDNPEFDPTAALAGIEAPVVLLCPDSASALDALLARFVLAEGVTLVGPQTDHFFGRRPVFPISPPKAGTHLLVTLLEAFGYQRGHTAPERPFGGVWYYLEFTNAHTGARDFFIDSVRRGLHGNRIHPFSSSPCVLIYRHPYDILASEAGYYHRDGNTAFAGYLSHLAMEDRLLRLVDDAWLLGSLRDRVGQFVAWLDFPNVFPVSFEELVGPAGGGDAALQSRSIWSLQLKLHVPGTPEDYAQRVFDPSSPTFASGQIGGHRGKFTAAVWAKLDGLGRDYIEAFGYGADSPFSERMFEFARRVPRYSKINHDETELLVEQNFLAHSIHRFKGNYIGIAHQRSGIQEQDVLVANDLATVRFLIEEKLLRQRLTL